MKKYCLMLYAFFVALSLDAQSLKPSGAAFDGTLVAGYVDGGGFINMMGPNVSLSYKSSRLLLGMIPSLRLKKDGAVTGARNALVTPGLGIGLSYFYKRLGLQVPLFYNPKTASKDGKWVPGVGLGWRLK